MIRKLDGHISNNINFNEIVKIASKKYPRLKSLPFSSFVGGPCLPKDLETFIEQSEDWQADNTEDEKYYYKTIVIQDNDSLCFTYAEKLLTRLCSRSDGKITKVLLYNEKNADNPKKIVSSRHLFKQRLNSSYQTRRDAALAPVESILNKEVIPCKKLNEFPLELWCMNQLDDEEEPVEISFDLEEG